MFTHEGYVIGCDARTPDNYRKKVRLRETKTLWVTESGVRFRKPHGRVSGDFPLYRVDIDSIRPIDA